MSSDEPPLPLEATTRRRFALATFAGTLVYALSAAAAPEAPFSPFTGALLSFAVVAGLLTLHAHHAPCLARRESWLVLVPLGALVVLALGRDALPLWLFGAAVNVSLLTLGGLVGGAVGGRVPEAGHLVLLGWVASAVDVASVFAPSGPTAQLMESPEVALPLVTLSWPIYATSAIEPLLGVGDVAIASLFAAAARRLALPRRRLIVGLAAGFAATLAALLIFERNLPALPMLCGGAVLALGPASWHVPPADRFKGIAFALLVTAASGVMLASRFIKT